MVLPSSNCISEPAGEIANRVDRLRHEMLRNRVDFLVLTDQVNIEYFFGYRTLTWAYKARPIFAIISMEKQHLISAPSEMRNLEQVERPFETTFYDGYLQEAVNCLIDTIRQIGSGTTFSVAIDYDQDFFGRGSLTLLRTLEELVGRERLIPAGPTIWPVRRIKSLYEIEQKKRAFNVVNKAFDEVISETCIGVSERELYCQIQSRFYLLGAETADPIAMSFGRGDMIYNRPPGNRQLRTGDYVWTDFRATIGGYPADRNRIARAGVPENWEVETYSLVRQVTVELAQTIRPGETTGAIFQRYLEMWDDCGLPEPYRYLSRIGHGGGLDVTEPPSICREGKEIVEAGMILHLEPKLEVKQAVFQFEEVICVGESENTFLSEISPEHVPVINERNDSR